MDRKILFVVFLLGLFSYCNAQSGESLGDVARRTRAARSANNSDCCELKQTVAEATKGPISHPRFVAFYIEGVSAESVAAQLVNNGINFEPDIAELREASVSPTVITALMQAPRISPVQPESVAFRQALSSAMKAYGQKRYDTARVALEAAIGENSADADLDCALGSILERQANWDSAKQAYSRALQLRPNSVYAHSRLSIVSYRLGDTSTAATEARKVLSLQPGNEDARRQLARLTSLRFQEDNESRSPNVDSLGDGDQSQSRAPEEAREFNRLGLEKMDKGDYSGAAEAFNKAIAIHPKWWGYYFNLGLSDKNLGRDEQSLDDYLTAERLAPQELRIKQNIGYTQCKLRKWKEAVATFQQILNMDPTWNMARPCLARSLRALQRVKEADQIEAEERKYKELGYED